MRIILVRENIVEGVAKFLPEMIVTGVQQSNIEHHRQHLERIMQMNFSTPTQETG